MTCICHSCANYKRAGESVAPQYVLLSDLAAETSEEKVRTWGAGNIRYVEYRFNIQKEWDRATDHTRLRFDLKDYRVPLAAATEFRAAQKQPCTCDMDANTCGAHQQRPDPYEEYCCAPYPRGTARCQLPKGHEGEHQWAGQSGGLSWADEPAKEGCPFSDNMSCAECPEPMGATRDCPPKPAPRRMQGCGDASCPRYNDCDGARIHDESGRCKGGCTRHKKPCVPVAPPAPDIGAAFRAGYAAGALGQGLTEAWLEFEKGNA